MECLLQVTYYEFHREEVDQAMEHHKKGQRSLSHVPSRVENKEAFNILMVSPLCGPGCPCWQVQATKGLARHGRQKPERMQQPQSRAVRDRCLVQGQHAVCEASDWVWNNAVLHNMY